MNLAQPHARAHKTAGLQRKEAIHVWFRLRTMKDFKVKSLFHSLVNN